MNVHLAPAAESPDSAQQDLRPRSFLGYGVAWFVFWFLLTTLEVQEYWRQGGQELWKPLFWEASSFLVASVVVGLQWRRIHRLDALLSRPWHWFASSLLLVPIVFGIRTHAALSNAQIRLERERRLAQHAQLLQLAQQIEPHFLFNALNTIAATIPDDPVLADTLLTKLASLLRAATELARKPESRVEEELNLLKAYSTIMCQRFAGRVDVGFEIAPETGACRIPTLLMQPLLENAFHHGVERHSGRTNIQIRVTQTNNRLLLEVQDSTGEIPAAPIARVGLTNLRERLQTRYGANARFSLSSVEGGGALARIEMPCEY